ncbi:hypothetical protein [Pontibacter virosus]|uniref:Uncharacterized protein n=1 Tax=Pontibacter virosus TaxID=1765052 RepID=A0A2U1B5D1_9BACT|nr:hypothetical protein [Pontibacter virosus]PVY43870.1 hypothetical protein C8E01_101227 [Pontibacter virosus]
MKKLILQNTLATQLLIYGGMALIMWPAALRIVGIVNFENDFSPVFLYAGLSLMLIGGALRIYHEQRAGEPVFEGYLFRVAVALAIVAIMMVTGIIKTPAFLQNLF